MSCKYTSFNLGHKESILEVSAFSPSSDGMQTSPILFPPFYFSLISTLRDIGDPTPFNEYRCFEDEVVQ
jgi:hypothetical protein